MAEKRAIMEKPKLGIPFNVYPTSINRRLFTKNRENPKQEYIRNFILDVFDFLDTNPETYSKPFQTLMPNITWTQPTYYRDQEKIAVKLGGHVAQWWQQVLEWAQRLENGETWEALCNEKEGQYTLGL